MSKEAKRRKTWLWVLGWVFIFPIPASILIIRSRIKKPAKAVLVSLLWLLFIMQFWIGAKISQESSDVNKSDDTLFNTSINADEIDYKKLFINSIGAADLVFCDSVPNDDSGYFKICKISASEQVVNFAVPYYRGFFEDDREVHAIINNTLKTTTRILVDGYILDVDVFKHIEGEEDDAYTLFCGDLCESYTVNKVTEEIEQKEVGSAVADISTDNDEAIAENSTSTENDPRVTETTDIIDSSLEVHFIDVGQGDSTLIICDGEAMLIDAGDNSKGTTVQLYLKKHGIEELKYVIGTHPDADHIGGLDVIIYKFSCDTIIMTDVESDTNTYRDVIDTINYKNYIITYPVIGNEYRLGEAKFTILGPLKKYDSDNNNSIVIKLLHGTNSFLFEYSRAVEPPVRCGESHVSGLTGATLL